MKNISSSEKEYFYVHYKLSPDQHPFLVFAKINVNEIHILIYSEGTIDPERIFWNFTDKTETYLIDFIQLLVETRSSLKNQTEVLIGSNFGFPETIYKTNDSIITTKLVRVIQHLDFNKPNLISICPARRGVL